MQPRTAPRLVLAAALAVTMLSLGGLAWWRPATPARAQAEGDAAAPAAEAAPYPSPLEPAPCPLCAEDPGVPVRRLSADDARAIGKAYADSNVARLARLDSLLRAGELGKPGSPLARRQALVLARLLTLNAYSYMVQFSIDRQVVVEADETALGPAFETFSDPGVYPIARLRRARMGLGRMCAHYDLSEKMQTETILSGQKLRVRVDDVRIQGQTQRVLIMDLPTGLFDVVEVWIAPHVSIDVELVRSAGPPSPYDLYVLEHVRGLWVHKWGVHRPEALVFWTTPRDPNRTAVPEEPLVGARIYVPHLKLRLPSILPDIGFEDLREVDLPQPILELAYLREQRYPDWLRPARMRGFRDWTGVGPLMPDLRQRFPNL